MAKKRQRSKQVSKGERHCQDPKLLNSIRRDTQIPILNKLEAWIKGQNPWMTIENPNKNETNKRFIRVKANEYFGGTYKTKMNRLKSM